MRIDLIEHEKKHRKRRRSHLTARRGEPTFGFEIAVAQPQARSRRKVDPSPARRARRPGIVARLTRQTRRSAIWNPFFQSFSIVPPVAPRVGKRAFSIGAVWPGSLLHHITSCPTMQQDDEQEAARYRSIGSVHNRASVAMSVTKPTLPQA